MPLENSCRHERTRKLQQRGSRPDLNGDSLLPRAELKKCTCMPFSYSIEPILVETIYNDPFTCVPATAAFFSKLHQLMIKRQKTIIKIINKLTNIL